MTDMIRKSDALALADGYWQSIGSGLPEGKSDEAIIDTADAIAAWNTRPTPLAEALAVPEVAALVEAASPLMDMTMWTESAEDTEMVIVSVGTVRRIRAALRAIGERAE